MMSDKDHNDDIQIEALFEDARAHPPAVPDALMARILADATSAQPPATSWRWRNWFAAFGGLPALGGLVTATCVGFWMGVAPPDLLPDLAGAVMGVETTQDTDFEGLGISGYGWDIGEG